MKLISAVKAPIGRFFTRFNKHDLLTLAAALAFYTALSLAPLLLITISVLGLLHGDAQNALIHQVGMLMGSQAADTIALVIKGADRRTDLSFVANVLGFATLIFSASGVFAQLQSSLNLIWDSDPNAISGLWAWLRRRLLSMGMVLSLGFISLVSLGISAVLSFVFQGQSEGGLWALVNAGISFAIYTLLFALIYKILPDRPLRWRSAFVGGALTAALFTFGKWLIGLYIGQSAVGSAYGAAGTLIIFLVWVYYSSLVVFIGAEITAMRDFPLEESRPAKF